MIKEMTLEFANVEENLGEDEKLVIKSYMQEDIGFHSHDFYELAYVTGGSAVHTLNNETCTLKKGDYFIVDYGSIHSYENSHNLTLINCLFLPEVIGDTLSGCRSFNTLMHGCLLRYNKLYIDKTPANRVFHDRDDRILLLLEGMVKEYQEKQPGFNEIFRCRLMEVLILIMRNIIDHTSKPTNNSIIRQMIHYINHNYQKQGILSEFCDKYHFAPQYISRKFKQETGFSIRDYLHKVRMEKCCELLAGSDLPVAEVAQEIGYRDIKFFNELFKRLLKMTPRDYRRMASRNGIPQALRY